MKRDLSRLTVTDIVYSADWTESMILHGEEHWATTKTTHGNYRLTGVQKDGEELPEFLSNDLEHIIEVVKQSILDRSANSYRRLERHVVLESSETVFHVRLGYGDADSRSPAKYLHEIKIEVVENE
ncbi:hypothetical protein VPFG_00301 [Vibrio phage nt-1]|uniref:Uncharacterized protein n=1 Tax=Vibrio phage nt-1 TaxID=115992 RepID=R9TIT6_9CAUD|nr:hypothetical protein VPFG_00301 [Vibrio phage nt-1]AGN30300.1 hypothetical protein VPFG_00301 [Vibrio phage nt-1]